jgi:hypothetical protein
MADNRFDKMLSRTIGEDHKMKLIQIIILAVLLIGIANSSEPVTIQVTGTGVINDGDTTKARNEAVNDALRKSIEQAVKSFLSSPVIAEKQATIEEKIYSRAEGYLSSFIVENEGLNAQSPNTYLIEAKIGVLLNNIKNDLGTIGITMQKEGYPRLLVIINQKNIDEIFYHRQSDNLNIAETKTRDALMAKGFPFVNEGSFLKNMNQEQEKAIYEENIDTLLKLARAYDAQAIVIGKAVGYRAEGNTEVGGMASLRSTVILKAIRAANGDSIAGYVAKSSQVHVDAIVGGTLAIARASEDAANAIASDIAKNWSSDLATGVRITLVANGIRNDIELAKFKEDFQTRIKGIKALNQRTFTDGTVAFDMVATFNCDDLMDQLNAKGLTSFDIKIRSQSPNYLELNVKAR